MRLDLLERVGTIDFAVDPLTDRIFAKEDGSSEWRYVVLRHVEVVGDEAVVAHLETAPIRSLTTRSPNSMTGALA